MTNDKESESHLKSLHIVEEAEPEVFNSLGCCLFLHEHLVELMIDVVLQESVKRFHVINLQDLLFGDLKHLDDGCMDCLFACQKEQVKHHLAQFFRRVVIAHN